MKKSIVAFEEMVEISVYSRYIGWNKKIALQLITNKGTGEAVAKTKYGEIYLKPGEWYRN